MLINDIPYQRDHQFKDFKDRKPCKVSGGQGAVCRVEFSMYVRSTSSTSIRCQCIQNNSDLAHHKLENSSAIIN